MKCMAWPNGTCDYDPPPVKDLLVVDSLIVVQPLTRTGSTNNHKSRLGIQNGLGEEALRRYPTLNQPLLIGIGDEALEVRSVANYAIGPRI